VATKKKNAGDMQSMPPLVFQTNQNFAGSKTYVPPAGSIQPTVPTIDTSIPTTDQLLAQANTDVGAQYDAQIAAINAQVAQAKKNYGLNDKQTKKMYNDLVKNIKGNSGTIKDNFNSGISSVANDTRTGIGDVNNIYGRSQSNIAGTLAKFGLGQGAGDSLQTGANQQSLITSLMAHDGAAIKGQLSTNKATDLAFNTEQANSSAQAGTETRTALLRQLNDTINGYGNQKISVMGQRASAVASRASDLQSQALTRQQNLQNMLYQAQQDQAAAQAKQDSAAQAQAQQQATNDRANFSQQWSTMGPEEKATYKASQLFGSDRASTAVGLINSVMSKGTYANYAQFEDAVRKANNGSLPENQLLSLANYVYNNNR